MYELRMPKFGLTMEEGTITKWYKKEGEFIKKGEPLLEVESEKIVNDIESPISGYLSKILAKEGESRKVGEIIAYIVEEEELKIIEEKKEKGIPVSPLAKKLAKEYGIDISKIKGSGPGGRIIEKDIRDYINKFKEKEEIIEPLTPIRKEIIERLSKSYKTSILVTNVTKVDFTNLIKVKNKYLNVISLTSMLIKILSIVLEEIPKFNSHFDGEKIIKFKNINIGFAVDTERGLIVPVIKDVQNLGLEEIDKKVKELSLRARNNKLSYDDVEGSHFTLTNLGMMRTDFFTPVLNGMEVAILGVGRTTKEVWVENGNFIIKDVSYFSLSYDHRVIDGADAAKFLDKLCSLIEKEDNFKTILKI
jgi:pyruvate dehydrogenase E2 component (dihydrolipoamide acetyltransferase)